MKTIITLITCPDAAGLIRGITERIGRLKGNIVSCEEWVDADDKEAIFLMRVVSEHAHISKKDLSALKAQIERYSRGVVDLHDAADIQRVAFLATSERHCLDEIYGAYRRDELVFEPVFVGSNRTTLKKAVEKEYRWKFIDFPIGSDEPGIQEREIIGRLKEYRADVLVLAKYMQIISPEFIATFPNIINTHHSFLPAFKGAKPYRQAYERGVKIVGATTHFVTEHLDDGPIILQETCSVEGCSAADMQKRGRRLERLITVDTLDAILNRKVIRYGNKTFVFD